MAARRFVIVGAGLAGAKTAEALREQGFDGDVVLLGAEPDAPYDRPPLSKDYLQASTGREAIAVHEPGWYDAHEVTLRTSTTVTALDPTGHQLTLAGGETVPYDKLVLATGSSPRRPPIPGADLEGVHTLRTRADSDRIAAAIAAGGPLVVVGAGWIGLEVAAAARTAGVAVTVLEAAAGPLLVALGPEMGTVFAELHREHGVDLRLNARLIEIVGDGGRVREVRLGDGTLLDAATVLIAVGAEPNTALARRAGLAVDDGVVVDAALRTSHPDIHAVGDIARAYHPGLGRLVRVEHWATARHQPETAATAMLERPACYDALPYFFTDQYELGMEYLGYIDSGGYDQVVVRGDVARCEFIAFWTRREQVLAAMNVNIWDVGEPLTALIQSSTAVDLDRLTDPEVPLESLVRNDG